MPFENESNAENGKLLDAPKKITTAWLFLVILTVSASLAGSEIIRENFPAHYATFMVWAEVLFLLGCMFLISWISTLPFFAKTTPDDPVVSRDYEWPFFIGIWLILPLLAIWTDIFARSEIHGG